MTFQKVANVMSFTRAAAELNYAQSSVTSQIKALETSLQAQLFDRLGGRIRLTDAGERLLPYADRMLALADEARADVAAPHDPRGTLIIGTTRTITSHRLPPLLETFRHRYPRIHLSLRPSPYADTRRALRQDLFDLGFLMEEETEHPGLETLVLTPERLVLAAAPTHPLASSHRVTTADLRPVPILTTEAPCAARDLLATEVGGTFLDLGTTEAIKRGATAGLGVCLLPATAVTDAVHTGDLVLLPWEAPFTLHTQLAWRQGKRLSRELRLFIEEAKRLIPKEEEETPHTARRYGTSALAKRCPETRTRVAQ
ncbi:LysR family transcriptional regulator [Streptomyces mashuensis]|nr:LysR family transcriptional regulator [Streptomyces mashuensis]